MPPDHRPCDLDDLKDKGYADESQANARPDDEGDLAEPEDLRFCRPRMRGHFCAPGNEEADARAQHRGKQVAETLLCFGKVLIQHVDLDGLAHGDDHGHGGEAAYGHQQALDVGHADYGHVEEKPSEHIYADEDRHRHEGDDGEQEHFVGKPVESFFEAGQGREHAMPGLGSFKILLLKRYLLLCEICHDGTLLVKGNLIRPGGLRSSCKDLQLS